MNVKEMGLEGVDRINVVEVRDKWRGRTNAARIHRVAYNVANFVTREEM